MTRNIYTQILYTDLHTFPFRIRGENFFRRSKYFPLADYLINSHNIPLNDVLIKNTLLREDWCWSAIYLVDSFIHLLRNWTLCVDIPLLSSTIAMLLCKLDYSQLVGHSATLTFHSGKFRSHDRYSDNLTCCFPRSAVS